MTVDSTVVVVPLTVKLPPIIVLPSILASPETFKLSAIPTSPAETDIPLLKIAVPSTSRLPVISAVTIFAVVKLPIGAVI